MSRLEERLRRLEKELAVDQPELVAVENQEEAEQYAGEDGVVCVITGVPPSLGLADRLAAARKRVIEQPTARDGDDLPPVA